MTAEGGKTTTTTTTTMTTAVADQIEKAARRSAASLNREALLSAYESNYALSRHRGGKGRTEQAPCREVAEANERSTERDCLAAELEGVREELRRRGGGGGDGRRRILRAREALGTRRRGPSSSSPASTPTGWTGRPTASAPRSPAWPGQTGRAPSITEHPAMSSDRRGGRATPSWSTRRGARCSSGTWTRRGNGGA